MGFNHVVLVAKLNDIQMKGKHEETMTNFFTSIAKEDGEDFGSKVTGYCLVYAPYYICMLESEDSEYLDFVLKFLKNQIGLGVHEQIWCLFQTEEVPERAFDQFQVRSFPSAQSQAEIKGLTQLERV